MCANDSSDGDADVIRLLDRLLQAGEDRVTALLKGKEDELHRVSVTTQVACNAG